MAWKGLLSANRTTRARTFEALSCPPPIAVHVWDKAGLESRQKKKACFPAGLGARKIPLRFGLVYPPTDRNFSEEITPLEAGLGFFVKLDKRILLGKVQLA